MNKEEKGFLGANIPLRLLDKLKKQAEKEERSVTKQLIILLRKALR